MRVINLWNSGKFKTWLWKFIYHGKLDDGNDDGNDDDENGSIPSLILLFCSIYNMAMEVNVLW